MAGTSKVSHAGLSGGLVITVYWHPIRLAGESAMLDLNSNGRQRLSLGSGAYHREFDQVKPELLQSAGIANGFSDQLSLPKPDGNACLDPEALE